MQTSSGWRAFIRVKGTLYSRRFDRDATITEMRDWRAAQRVDVQRHTAEPAAGTFAADVDIYLASVKTMPTYAEREDHLRQWQAALGSTRPRQSISSAEIRAALQQWRQDGKRLFRHYRDPITDERLRAEIGRAPLSESACNHRRSALMHFFSVMNGKGGSNPVKDVPKFREPDPEPRGVSYTLLKGVFAAMPASATKARVLVLATTGLPASTLMRLEPDALNVSERILTVPRRRKGKGTKSRVLPLSPDALKAFKLLTTFDAWGPFSPDALRHSLQRACAKAGVRQIRGYDLRHSFGTAAYQASGDIRAVQALLDHSDPKLTERYTLGAVDYRMRDALVKMRKVTGTVTTTRKRSRKAGLK